MTPPTVPLILSQEPVRGQLGPVKATSPSRAVVYATAAGELAWFDGRPLSWSQQFFSKYRTRYEVDVSDHRRTVVLRSTPLPSRDQVHRFEATVDVGFRVTDPTEVVRRNIQDALVVVYGFLADYLRPLARGFAIDQADAAEAHLNGKLAHEQVLPEGITLYRCSVKLDPDAAAAAFIAARTKAVRDRALGTAAHERAVAETRSREMIKDLEQQAELNRQRERERALAGTGVDIDGLIKRHLVMHPEDTGPAIEMLSKWAEAVAGRQEVFDQRSVDVFQFMVAKDLIQPADVELIRRQALARVHSPALAPGAASALPVVWGGGAALPSGQPAPDPLTAPAQVQPTVLAGRPVTVANPPTPVDRPAAGSPVLPCYLVLDESAAMAGCLPALGNALRTLQTALVMNQGAQYGLRLSVLGMAEETRVGLAMCQVEWTTGMPAPEARGGASYASAFEKLLEVVPADVRRLKAEHPTVLRPVAFLLLAGTVDDGARWRQALRRLIDPAVNGFVPTLVAVGVGRAAEPDIAEIARQPQFGLVAEDRADLPGAVERFAELLQRTVVRLGDDLAAGRPGLELAKLPGLRPAVRPS
ncbi:hypothetical protein LN042_28350 [Kitasatospora sp. RB6PN24]|uniref:hypothetical protein n=1 Tax=Kitasatospora humi TaxID=2893891 RepID=UPI001E46117A|nr:hypothetical protein [Kitasatospora humi]MCC9310935.1 hypothetical protein [Kitasatospora humi]